MTDPALRLFKCRTFHRVSDLTTHKSTVCHQAIDIEGAAKLCVAEHAKRFNVSPDAITITLIKPVRRYDKPDLSAAALLLATDINQHAWRGLWVSPTGLDQHYYKALLDAVNALVNYGDLSSYGFDFAVMQFEVRWFELRYGQKDAIRQILLWIA